MLIRFHSDAFINGKLEFKSGTEVELDPNSAWNWVRRGMALKVDKESVKSIVEEGITKSAKKSRSKKED
jgi:hypothetical protein